MRAMGARPSPGGTLEASGGQGIVEYGLLLGLTSLLTVVWLVVFGGVVADALAIIGEAIDRATGG